jgi:cell division protein ZapA
MSALHECREENGKCGLIGVYMNKMNDIEVIINNKRYNLRGYESEEYLQRIASYINNKHLEFKKQDFYRMLDSEMKNILMEINIADDYFKIRNQIKEIEAENDAKSNEIYNLKHELVSTQTKLEVGAKEIESLRQELNEAQKKMIRLETELMDKNRS